MSTAYPERERKLRERLRDLAIDEGSLSTPLRRCELERCKGMCCHDGVYVGEEEREVIGGMYGEEVFEERGGRWKTRTVPASEEQLGEGYPEHFPLNRCVFLDEHHLCTLQKRAVEEGRHPWFYKPMPCWMHPLTVVWLPNGRPLLTLPTREDDPHEKPGYAGFASCTTCGKRAAGGEAAREVLRTELGFLGELVGKNLNQKK